MVKVTVLPPFTGAGLCDLPLACSQLRVKAFFGRLCVFTAAFAALAAFTFALALAFSFGGCDDAAADLSPLFCFYP